MSFLVMYYGNRVILEDLRSFDSFHDAMGYVNGKVKDYRARMKKSYPDMYDKYFSKYFPHYRIYETSSDQPPVLIYKNGKLLIQENQGIKLS